MIHAQRASTFMSVRPRLRTDMGRLGRHQLQRRAGGVAHVQRTALKRDVDEAGFDANTVEMRLGLDEVVIGEHTKPDAFAHSLALGLLQCQAVMASLLHAMQPDRVVRLVADDKPNDLGVERAARLEIARCEHKMARPRDVEWRTEIGLRMGHAQLSL